MGAWITDNGITRIAPRAMQNHLERLKQLYEQTRKLPALQQAMRVLKCWKRWEDWARQAVPDGILFAETVETGSSAMPTACGASEKDHRL